MSGLLGVDCSATGKIWRMRGADYPDYERSALTIAQRHDVSDFIARVIAGRGSNINDVESFLNPTLREMLPDPLVLNGMEEAVERLALAVYRKEIIGLLADYDVDGATSAALFIRYFSSIERNTVFHVPDRLKEGYGPNLLAIKKLKAKGARIVITLDCGIVAFDTLSQSKKIGMDVLVVDHHMAEPTLPKAVAVVNPNRLDENSDLGHLAAVGVSFLLVVGLNRRLREMGFFVDRVEPKLTTWLDLVALGTVCDVVALKGLNRAFVAQGLRVLCQRRNQGLKALSSIARINGRVDSYHLGFILGPRVNAAGRVGESGLGTRLLSTIDESEAIKIATVLDQFNKDRRGIEEDIQSAATRTAEKYQHKDDPVFVIGGEAWHAGVIGIVASRLRELYDRPVCVIGFDGELGKGSGRSVQGFDLGSAVIAAYQLGLLEGGGGHRMAAGFTIRRQELDNFRSFLIDRFIGEKGLVTSNPVLKLDGILAPGGVKQQVIDDIALLGPFGAGNPVPKFAVTSARITRTDWVGEKHLRCSFKGFDGGNLQGIAFRAMNTRLGDALLTHTGRQLHVAGQLQSNEWNGRKNIQIIIEDIAVQD